MRRYLLLVGVSLLFVAWSPFIGQIRDVIKRALGEAFSPVVGVLLGVTVLAAGVWGARHVRERRARRFGLMGLALLLFVGYAAVMRTGVPDVDAVERIHFVEYGLVATSFYRAMSVMTLGAVVPMTLLVGTLVGIGKSGSSGSCPPGWATCGTSFSTCMRWGAAYCSPSGSTRGNCRRDPLTPVLASGASSGERRRREFRGLPSLRAPWLRAGRPGAWALPFLLHA